MRELLYQAAEQFTAGKKAAEEGRVHDALAAYGAALDALHAVRPQRQRDVLLAHVYLERFQLRTRFKIKDKNGARDLRLGYSYARSTADHGARQLAEKLWQAYLAAQYQTLKREVPRR